MSDLPKGLHKIEAIPGYFVIGYDLGAVEYRADLVRKNEPFIGARVRHGSSDDERLIIGVDSVEGTVRITRRADPSQSDVVPWSECRWQ